jgi:ubiquinone/menaquinone biosynthesis C-methylase UbiE
MIRWTLGKLAPGEMQPDVSLIAETFSARASTYAHSDWHRRCAERLIALAGLRPSHQVIDAATGTGFAALAAAHAVGRDGHVLGVDISPGMLREAKAAVADAGLANIDLLEADAVSLPQLQDESFDVVTCAENPGALSRCDVLYALGRV